MLHYQDSLNDTEKELSKYIPKDVKYEKIDLTHAESQ